MTTQPKPCSGCAFWQPRQPGDYRGACTHPRNAGTYPPFDHTCPAWQSKNAPKPAAGLTIEQRAEELAAASLEERVRAARKDVA